jgi:hypothetical protein
VVEERWRLPGLLRLVEQTDPNAISTLSDVEHHRGAAVVGPRFAPLVLGRKQAVARPR